MEERKQTIKTLLLITSTAGGAGLHAYYLARYLPRDRFELTAAFSPGYVLDDQFKQLDIPVHILTMSRKLNPLTNIRGFFEICRLMKQERFQMVCMECSIAGLLGRVAAWLTGVPVRVMILQVYASHPNQIWLTRIIYHWIERAMDLPTTKYVAVSNAMKEYGRNTGIMKPDKVDVIYNSVEIDQAEPADRRAIRRELGLEETDIVIGTAGRCETQKGLSYLLEAAAILCRNRNDLRFVIMGDGPLKPELETHADNLGITSSVIFTGWRNDVTRLMWGLDIFCLASLWESFGMVLVEAMSRNLPIVATRVDGIPEVVQEGKTGLLVPPRDPQAIADALGRMIRDPESARKMGNEGCRRALACFNVDRMIVKYDKFLYELALNCKRSRHTGVEPACD